jgi:hypothetical protein
MAQTTHEKKLRCMQRNAQQQISADCTSPSIAAALLIASNLQQRVDARAASAARTGLPPSHAARHSRHYQRAS